MTGGENVNGAFERLALLVGEEGMGRLQQARVCVAGVGGVGSFAVEALARAGIGHLLLIDFDTVKPSNLNRQIVALHSTVGRPKVEIMAERVKEINPACEVHSIRERLKADNISRCLQGPCDYVVDAIDEADAKTALLLTCVKQDLPVVSSMGAANKLLPDGVRVADIGETRQCPLARAIRKQLRHHGIHSGITVVYSEEDPIRLALAGGAFQADRADEEGAKRPQGTISYMPALFGLQCAAVVLRHLLRDVTFRRRGQTDRLR